MNVIVALDPQFPLDEVESIGVALMNSGGLVAGYRPPQAGTLSVPALIFAKRFQQLSTRLLPDRNLVSRMAGVARSGIPSRPLDDPTQMALNVMASAQAMDIDIEPSIAFHELGHRLGNDRAHEELSWFRAADEAQADVWIDVAWGRANRLRVARPAEKASDNLSHPLHRWRCNYLIALKVAELELSESLPFERVKKLLDWMKNEFIVAGPAAMFSTMYLSPNTARRRMIKSLRSLNRQKAIAGIMNAAWDITHLSDFVRRSRNCEQDGTRNIFATADKNLARIATVLLVGNQQDALHADLLSALSKWWNDQEADQIAWGLSECLKVAVTRPAPVHEEPLDDRIRDAEGWALKWTAKQQK